MKLRSKSLLIVILILITGLIMAVPVYAADIGAETNQALALKQLGLFKGVSDTEFDLNRAPSRTEALVMLVRVLGKESEALNGNYTHPFTDVASWADKYIGYAYQNGLTKGVSATQFGSGNANSDMYLTFVLRALGYNDAAGDFSWDQPDTLASSVGILTADVDTSNFLRADVVLVSWAALDTKLKDGSQTLAAKLISAAAFTEMDYSLAKQTAGAVAAVNPANTYTVTDGIAAVKSMAEFKGALADSAVTEIEITQAFDITENIAITKPLTVIELTITNTATVTINANVTLGGATIQNMGSIIVGTGGFVGDYMTELNNHGQFTVEAGGQMEIDRGGKFINIGTLTNSGTITITGNGGNMRNEATGTIINNGTINCTGYYDNYGTYSGTGTEPVGI